MGSVQPAIADTAIKDGALRLEWSDGTSFSFHPMWLRERLDDGETLDARTRQRAIDAGLLALDIALTEAAKTDNGSLRLTFSDGKSGVVFCEDLRAAVQPLSEFDLIGSKELWDGTLPGFPKHRLEDVADQKERLLALLNDLARVGCVLVTGVPVEKNGILEFANLIGNIKLTNWGGVEDVRVSTNAFDLTLTGRGLEPHVDNPYRYSTIGYVLLHCLHNSCAGGESTVVDGHFVAEKLRREHPEAFRVLASTAVYFRYEDENAILENCRPLIALDKDDRVVSVAYSNRTEFIRPSGLAEMSAFYEARKLFADLLYSTQNTVEFKLEPGQLAVFDNYRVLHGRRAFDTAEGERHMRQAYMDRDTVSSRQKVLMRDCGRR